LLKIKKIIMPKKQKLRLYIMRENNGITEYIPYEKWLKTANKKQIYNFLYNIRLKAYEISKVDLKKPYRKKVKKKS